jgi:hypothetical protein
MLPESIHREALLLAHSSRPFARAVRFVALAAHIPLRDWRVRPGVQHLEATRANHRYVIGPLIAGAGLEPATPACGKSLFRRRAVGHVDAHDAASVLRNHGLILAVSERTDRVLLRLPVCAGGDRA